MSARVVIDHPEGLVELESRYWQYFDFLLGIHLNPPRGYSKSISYVLAHNLREHWPKGVTWGDVVLWLRKEYLPVPFDPDCIKIMSREQYESSIKGED